ncbi:MAG: acetoacetate--CoA ligase [Candidatus Planktophila sp.]|nr:acetoacetate--CoA ligase [Candidatus Planktophila sp.]
MNTQLWQPHDTSGMAITRLQSDCGFDSYSKLHAWSIENPGLFWSRAWDDCGIIGEKGEQFYTPGKDFISARFFNDATLNVAENLLSKGDATEVAIISILENGDRSELTWGDLRAQVAATTAALKAAGVGKGDRVVAWVPNISETIIFALGALSIGAIVSTASPDFAPGAVQDRFGQIEPKILLASDSYQYNGKIFESSSKIEEIQSLLPTLSATIRVSEFQSWIAPYIGTPLEFTPLPFDHPGFVLFSSGTTGKPKCIIHSGAGVLLKASAEQLYQFEIKAQQRVFFFTTCGWMMWNWLTMALGRGATIVLFDGAPMFPTPSRLFDLAQDEKLDFLGLSAKFIDSAHKEGLTPATSHDLSAIKVIASTGSVLSPESFDYVYQCIKSDVHLASMSGGTDICGCFVAGVPTQPVYRGELQGACLGMATDVFNAKGESAAIDEKGELVCTVPFPSKPLGFWADYGNEKYSAAYFKGYPGVWTHGDFASKSSTGGFILFGRSDATLNSKGVRIGTAEIYRVVETFPEILEAMAVSQDWEGDTRVILFVVIKPGMSFTQETDKEIKKALRTQASPRHVPDLILIAPALPRTKSNKLVELAVTDVINGREVRNSDSLANPETLDWFKSLNV